MTRAPARPWVAGALVVGAPALAIVFSLAIGARPTEFATVIGALVGAADPEAIESVVVRELRVPRTVIGLLVGVALGLSGALMQGVTRNPIADPGLLGVTAGASFAVVLGISVMGMTTVLPLAGVALIGALVSALLIAAIAATSRATTSPAVLVVAGSAVTAGLTSATTLVLLGDPAALDRYRFWTVGSLTGRDLDTALTLAPLVVVGAVLALVVARPLDALALGDDIARSLGFPLLRTRLTTIIAIVLLTGAATAMAGPLVFVGLVGAHAARSIVGLRHAALLPASGALGAALVLLADTLGRLIVPPGELEVGLVIAVLGAPVLIALVRSRQGVLA